MKYEISKELFEAVMDVKKECYLQDIELIDENKIIYSYLVDEQFQEPRYDEELINDFFFKCKEWALKQGYDINSGYSHHLIDYTPKGYYCWIKHKKSQSVEMYRKLSEQQSVFDACEWILKELKK